MDLAILYGSNVFFEPLGSCKLFKDSDFHNTEFVQVYQRPMPL